MIDNMSLFMSLSKEKFLAEMKAVNKKVNDCFLAEFQTAEGAVEQHAHFA